MIATINLLTFIAGVFASIPSVYLFINLYGKNKYYSGMSLLLALTFVFHAVYHLISGIQNLHLVSEILETLGTFLVLFYMIVYPSNGGHNKL